MSIIIKHTMSLETQLPNLPTPRLPPAITRRSPTPFSATLKHPPPPHPTNLTGIMQQNGNQGLRSHHTNTQIVQKEGLSDSKEGRTGEKTPTGHGWCFASGQVPSWDLMPLLRGQPSSPDSQREGITECANPSALFRAA